MAETCGSSKGTDRRYIIIGAGAIGGTIGGRLAQAGHSVVLVARGEHLSVLRKRGLELVDPDGSRVLRIPAVGDPSELTLAPGDVLVLTVKSQDTLATLETWASAPVQGGGTAAERLPLLCAQNGVENERVALRRFASVYGVCVWLPAVHLQPGHVAARSAPVTGVLELGRYPAGADDLIREVARELSASGFSARVRADVMRWKYTKLLRNLGNAIDAAVAPGHATEALHERTAAEAQTVLKAAGIAVVSHAEVEVRRADITVSRPVPGLEEVGSSSWQSLVKGRRTIEADYLNGEIALLGRLHGVGTPINSALQQIANALAHKGATARSLPLEDIEHKLAATTADVASNDNLETSS